MDVQAPLPEWILALAPAEPLRIGFALDQNAPIDRPCSVCCHWSLPLHIPQPGHAPGQSFVVMRFDQWLVYHLHTRLHQRPVVES